MPIVLLGAGVNPRLWTPADDPTPKFWFKSDSTLNVTGGGFCSLLNDAGGGNATATPIIGDANSRFIYGTNTLNGRPVMTGDSSGSKGVFQVNNAASMSNNVGGMTLFSLARMTGTTGILIGNSRNGNNSQARATLGRGQTGTLDIEMGTRRLDADSYHGTADTTNRGTGWMLAEGIVDWQADSIRTYKDGTSLATVTGSYGVTGNSSATDAGLVTMGGYDSGGAAGFGNWDFAEAIQLRGAITQALRERYEGYFLWAWGLQAQLPGGHPYAASPPLTYPALSIPGGSGVGAFSFPAFDENTFDVPPILMQTAQPTTQVATIDTGSVRNITAAQTAAPTTQTATVTHPSAALSVAAAQTADPSTQTATLTALEQVAATQTAAATSQVATMTAPAAALSVTASQTAAATSQAATLAARAALAAIQTAQATSQTATVSHGAVASLAASQTADPTSQTAALAAIAKAQAAQTAEATTQAATIARNVAGVTASQTAQPASQTATVATLAQIQAAQTAQATQQAATLFVTAVRLQAAQLAEPTTQVARLGFDYVFTRTERTFDVLGEDRRLWVQAEDRSTAIGGENRTLGIYPEDREFDIA